LAQRVETDLIERFTLTRDPALREEIIVRYIPLVHFMLGRLGFSQSNGSEYEDLVNQGLLGLIEAVDHFNSSYGTKLSTYATLKIRSKVLDYLRELDWLPRTARQRVRAVQEAVTHLERELHREPTEQEIAAHLNFDMDTLQQTMIDSSHTVVSLDETLDDNEESGGMFFERLQDDKQEDPSQEFETRDMHQHMVEALKSLSEREQMVLSLYYFEELTFKEIGRVLGVTESRVCQLHGRAVINLKAKLNPGESKVLPAARPDMTRGRFPTSDPYR
jgi:RNA polymerase sigma factor for flagellar operon FliA